MRRLKMSDFFCERQSLNFQNLTPTFSGFEILNDVTQIIQNWLDSRLFANIFYNLKLAKEPKIFVIFRENS